MPTILVTGSSGTIGTRLCETLLKSGKDVVGVDWKANRWQPQINAITVQADLRTEEGIRVVRESIAKRSSTIEAVIHLAANARVYDLVERPDEALDNVLTLYRTLELTRALGIKKFLFSSSRETYGNAGKDHYGEGDVRLEHCESAYAASKLSGEAFVHAYSACYGIESVIFRFSNVYGMYDDSNRVFPLFIEQALQGKPLTVYGVKKVLDFTYIDDTVSGVLAALEHWHDAAGYTFNLGCGEGNTIVRLAELIKECTGSTSSIELAESRTGEVTNYIADITAARTILGFAPTVQFEEGVKRTVAWYKEHPLPKER